MNAHTSRTLVQGKNVIPVVVILSSVLILVAFGFPSSIAQSPMQGASPEKKERKIEARLAAHIPIKIKVKNLDKVKDLRNEDWISDLGVEITNTGTKPIYNVSFVLLVPDDVKADGKDIAIDLIYGRIELANLHEPLSSNDVPILPGETAVIKVPEVILKNWKIGQAKGRYANPKKLSLWFQGLSFGDGTGFLGPEGTPLPNYKKSSSGTACRTDEKRSEFSMRAGGPTETPPQPPETLFFQPVTFTGDFFMLKGFLDAPAPRRDICCPGSGNTCSRRKRGTIFCGCRQR